MATASNVTTGKPEVGGAIYRGSASASLPTSVGTGTAPTGFTSVGYISSDGVENDQSITSEDIKAWGGDIVDTSITEVVDKFKFTMIESLNEEALKVYYGDDNVSGAISTGITVKKNSKDMSRRPWVIDTIVKGGTIRRRLVIPDAKVVEKATVTYNDTDVIGYEITLAAYPDSNGNTHYEYIK